MDLICVHTGSCTARKRPRRGTRCRSRWQVGLLHAKEWYDDWTDRIGQGRVVRVEETCHRSYAELRLIRQLAKEGIVP